MPSTAFPLPGWGAGGAGPANGSISAADPPHPPGVSNEDPPIGDPQAPESTSGSSAAPSAGRGTPRTGEAGRQGMVGEKPQFPSQKVAKLSSKRHERRLEREAGAALALPLANRASMRLGLADLYKADPSRLRSFLRTRGEMRGAMQGMPGHSGPWRGGQAGLRKAGSGCSCSRCFPLRSPSRCLQEREAQGGSFPGSAVRGLGLGLGASRPTSPGSYARPSHGADGQRLLLWVTAQGWEGGRAFLLGCVAGSWPAGAPRERASSVLPRPREGAPWMPAGPPLCTAAWRAQRHGEGGRNQKPLAGHTLPFFQKLYIPSDIITEEYAN